MELGDWGEMPSDEEKGGSKERKEKKKKVGVATRRTAFYLCTTIFIRSSLWYLYHIITISEFLIKQKYHFQKYTFLHFMFKISLWINNHLLFIYIYIYTLFII